MPARSAVSILAAPAPVPRQCGVHIIRPWCLSAPDVFSSSFSSRPIAHHHRPFHGTARRRDDAIDNARNHYEILKVSPTASTSEIKKSFYSLSKAHHPDVHESSKRRAAAKRFMRISEAYSVLSSPSKRAKYDRDHMNLAQPPPSPPHGRKAASYASTGPAGGRPASGLSRRRGTFQGPPPSFFRSGGWGAQGEKRRAAHEESTGRGSSSMGGMGPGQDPFGHGGDVPHFDKASHEATWRNTERRREARAAEHGHRAPIEPEKGVAGMFFAISGVLLLSFVVPFLASRIWYNRPAPSPKEKKTTSTTTAGKT